MIHFRFLSYPCSCFLLVLAFLGFLLANSKASENDLYRGLSEMIFQTRHPKCPDMCHLQGYPKRYPKWHPKCVSTKVSKKVSKKVFAKWFSDTFRMFSDTQLSDTLLFPSLVILVKFLMISVHVLMEFLLEGVFGYTFGYTFGCTVGCLLDVFG